MVIYLNKMDAFEIEPSRDGSDAVKDVEDQTTMEMMLHTFKITCQFAKPRSSQKLV